MQRIKSFFAALYRIGDVRDGHLFLIFAVYLILLGLTVASHEPWMDEAQPWMYAQDFGAAELFARYLRYEGHPGLWYLLMYPPARAGLPYFSVNVLSALLAALGVFLFLRRSPFPPIIKTLFPFGFFVFYQYGVIARSYCLIPLILFSIAIKYRTKLENPILYAVLLCLLANISVHTLLLAGMLMLVQMLDVLKIRRGLDKRAKIRHAAGVLIFALSSLQIVFVLMPPADQSFALGSNFGIMNFFAVSLKMLAGSLAADETAGPRALAEWFSLAVVAATLLLMRQRGFLLSYLLPLLAILVFLAVKYSNVWHQGILFFLWIFALWIHFDDDRGQPVSKTGRLVLALMTVVLAVQAWWAFGAARCDFSDRYSGSYAAARFIRENGLDGRKIFASGWKTIAVSAYFDEKIFYNQNRGTDVRIWRWSMRNDSPVGFDEPVQRAILNERPEAVVVASDHLDRDPAAVDLEGYRLAAFFEGGLCWKTGRFEPDSYWIFLRSEP